MKQAAFLGIIKFDSADSFDRWWWLKVKWLLDELEKCFSATEEFNGDGMRIVTHFDRPRAAKLLDEFANRLAVGRG